VTMKPKSETDDARASDSNGAELRREKLGVEAAKGVRKALSGNSDNDPVFDTFAGRTGASSALGTPAEGAVEDGERSGRIETPADKSS
jgi:hypothetical protein